MAFPLPIAKGKGHVREIDAIWQVALRVKINICQERFSA